MSTVIKHEYTVECWSHGWLILAPNGQSGIPMEALSDIQPIFPKNAVMDAAISRHYQVTGARTKCLVAIGSQKLLKAWANSIVENLKAHPPEVRWWLGVDVGLSSASLFSALCSGKYKESAKDYGAGNVPRDADDFGRCKRLLDLFPEWRARLGEVVDAWPESKWSVVVAIWAELEKASAPEQCAMLQKVLSGTEVKS